LNSTVRTFGASLLHKFSLRKNLWSDSFLSAAVFLSRFACFSLVFFG
jgi:hypothetical protein